MQEWSQLALDFAQGETLPAGAVPLRREQRDQIVRLVEYAPFPRVRADQRRRSAFTRDISPSGMCLGVDFAEPEGSLLRIIVRCVDGRPTQDVLARVEWCRPHPDGHIWLGMSFMGAAPSELRPVRYTTAQLAVA
jgi:PilZ domain